MDMKNILRDFWDNDSFLAGLLKDFLFVLAVVAVFASISKIALGLYTPMVAVESGSMIPNIQIGDIIFVQSIDRTGITTYVEGRKSGYLSFDEYGDVILYKPMGLESRTPIIHRAMYYVNEGEPMWSGGPPAPYAGYITKGDNSQTNAAYDQQGSISPNLPIKKEWIIGVARFSRLPLAGCISLIPRGNFACLK